MRLKALFSLGLVFLLGGGNLAVASDLGLAEAVKKGDKEATRSLLGQKNVDVNAAQSDGATALHWAVHWDDLETAELLIRAGANVNAANDYGATPLWLASSNGNAAMVKKLLQAGANPNAALRLGETPLMAAAGIIGSVEVVKLLLAAGADVNAKEAHGGQSVLMWAVAKKRPEVVKVLIGQGADVGARSTGGFTPLLFAAQQGNVDSARLLLAAGADVNETSPDKESPLLVATASRHEKLAIFLIEKGADLNAVDYSGYTALHYATYRRGSREYYAASGGRNSVELLKALLAHGANPNARIVRDAKHELTPPIDQPYLRSPTRVVKADTRGGTTPVGATPFYLAALSRNPTAMRVLAAGGGDPNLGATETVYFLGGSGRRVNYMAGTTPLMSAAGVDEIGPNWNDLPEEEEKQALEAVKVAIELGADINAANEYGLTALHGAAFIGADSIIQFLMEKGANPELMDKHGQTPLSIARHVVTTGHGDNLDVRARRFRPFTSDLLVKLGAIPLEKSAVQVLRELKSDLLK